MPAETHQHGNRTDAQSIAMLLLTLLSDRDDLAEDTTLSEAGIGADDLDDLWDVVREELAERTVGPDLDPGDLDTQMTVAQAAGAMASLLSGTAGKEADA